MNKFIKYLIIILALMQLLSLSRCNKLKQERNTYKDLYVEGKQTFKDIQTKQGDIITNQKAILTEDKYIAEDLLKEIEYLRKRKRTIRTVVKTKTVFVRDSLYIPYTDTAFSVNVSDPSNNDSFVNFLKNTPHYTLGGKVKPKGILFDSIKFNNTMTLGIQEKGGIMNKKSVVFINNSNPYIDITQMNSVVTKKRPTKFNIVLKVSLGFGAGFAAGRLTN